MIKIKTVDLWYQNRINQNPQDFENDDCIHPTKQTVKIWRNVVFNEIVALIGKRSFDAPVSSCNS